MKPRTYRVMVPFEFTAPPTYAPVRAYRHFEEVSALTKSEARASVKKELGIRRHGRLPIGTQVEELA